MGQCSHHANTKHTESCCNHDITQVNEQAATNNEFHAGASHAWRIQGMDCPSCAAKIETALHRLPGVLSAEVRFVTERLHVRLSADTTAQQVEEAVDAIGFTALSEQTSATSDYRKTPWWQRYHAILILVTLLLLASTSLWLLPPLAPVLFTLATVWGLWPIGNKAWRLARNGSPFSIETLMTVAACGALLLGETAEAAMVLLLFMIGEQLESLAADKARSGVSALMALVPNEARKITAQGILTVDANQLNPDDEIEVHPGGRLPVDGVLLSELAAFDESAVTGESVPVDKQQGDTLTAGSLLVDVAVRVRVTSQQGNNTIDKILHLIETAEANKAPIARFIERFSRWYTPAMILAAALVALMPPLLMAADWETWIYRGLVLLLIGCPCALVISTPAAVTSALASASRMGILIKGGAALEQLGQTKTMAFDKTGTLTQGKPQLHQLICYPPFSESQVLSLAAALESGSHHPLAKSIVAAADEQGIKPESLAFKRTLPGAGIESEWQNQPLMICTPAHVSKAQLTAQQEACIHQLKAEGYTLAALMVNQQLAALFALSDPLRTDAKAGISALNALGIHSVMLTGDHNAAAKRIADQLGIDYQAQLSPQDKLTQLQQLEQSGALAMVGDGINDAPALKQASVGIAMGQGTDVALDSADAALTHSRLTGLADAVLLSRAANRNIRQNISLALGLKAIFLVTSILGITGLWLAILADTGATALVTLNALRLLGFKAK
ncbi:heavy metal translocating P-type ATPase [Oceanisphaera pacifica]|uniref:P-type Zn(2+) transporter n=1 Tax=Oceanisphaera pacifica TaxID=2818389 RepID=A0ABS3NF52_9GAMM|nr:heavy metal translocating P-type ATPase [Oceanisphaera pacifica]MBO1519208.1 heavy metal translocating P-type ATPase [Oceanisphaera pacifica]